MAGVATAITAAAGLAGTAIAAHGANKAAGQQASAANAATAEQQRQFDLINQQNAPYRQAGTAALNQLMGLYGLGGQQSAAQGPIDPNTGQPIGVQTGGAGTPDYSAFTNSPDYQFALQQGNQAVLRNRAALGGLASGNTGIALQQYGQGLASQQLGNYRNSLMGLIGTGQNSANMTGQAALATGQGIGNTLQNAGNAQAAGTLTGTNALIGGIGGLGQAAQNYFANRVPSPPPAPSGIDWSQYS